MIGSYAAPRSTIVRPRDAVILRTLRFGDPVVNFDDEHGPAEAYSYDVAVYGDGIATTVYPNVTPANARPVGVDIRPAPPETNGQPTAVTVTYVGDQALFQIVEHVYFEDC